MSTWLIDVLSSWAPLVFLLSGLLLAGYRACRRPAPGTGTGRQIDVDPDIRVRVTGKIS